jgi:Polyketide cyclase / dehydrase and lipid transport
VAFRGSRETVIDASPEDILAALADVEAISSWSTIHDRARVLARGPDGRPRFVELAIKFLWIRESQVLEYHWGTDTVVWDAVTTTTQIAQHAEYHLIPEGYPDDGEPQRTHVRFDLTLESRALVPEFVVRRGGAAVLENATAGLRDHVARRASGQS